MTVILKYLITLQDSFEQWRPVFFVGASVYIVSAIFFILFGTGNTQAWNFDDESKQEGKEEKGRADDMSDMNETIKNSYKDPKENSMSITTRT